MAKNRLQEVIGLLETQNSILILGHVAPDGDSLGSTLALTHLLNSQGKKAMPASLDGVPARFSYLPGIDKIIRSEKDLPNEVDCIVVLDCGELNRAGLSAEYAERRTIVNIDHHASNNGTLGTAWIDIEFAAVGQQIFHLAKEARWAITPDIATCLYTSLATDTGFFRHSNTTAKVFRDAALLLEARADSRAVVENAGERKTLQELCLIKESLGTLKQECGGRVTIIEVPMNVVEQCGVRPDEVEGMVEYAKAVPGTEVAILLKAVHNDVTRVSLRARGQRDVSKIAVSFGGGGHRLAAGCTLNVPLSTAREMVLAAIRQVVEHE